MSETTFSLAELDQLRAQVPRPYPRYCVVTPEYARRLLGELPRANEEPRINLAKFDFGSIQICEKSGQRAAAWFISDPVLVRAYLTGEITEATLEYLSARKETAEVRKGGQE